MFDKRSLPLDPALCSSEILTKLLRGQEYLSTSASNRIPCKLFTSKVGQFGVVDPDNPQGFLDRHGMPIKKC